MLSDPCDDTSARAFSGKAEPGFRQENATKQRSDADDGESIAAAPEPSVTQAGSDGLIEILQALARDESRARISVGDLLTAMGDRAFGAMMLIFALPNVVPTPPGTSSITGAPLVFLAAQLLLGRPPWLPRLIAERSMGRDAFAAVVEKIAPILARVQKLLRPRWQVLLTPAAERLMGLVCLLLALILVLPIPLGNMPPAVAICCFSFALLERDGVFSALGALISAIAVSVVAGVVYGFVKALLYLALTAFWQ